MAAQPKSDANRNVIGNISLSLDGRTTGLGGDYDMGWIVPHAITNGARDHMIAVTSPATTALPGEEELRGIWKLLAVGC